MKLQVTLLAGLMAAALSIPALAQVDQPPAPPAQSHHGDRMMRRFSNLNLSDQQKSQIRTLLENYRQTHPKGSTPDPDARKQLRGQILSVLTPDQRMQLEAQARQRRAERAQEGNPAPNPVASPATR